MTKQLDSIDGRGWNCHGSPLSEASALVEAASTGLHEKLHVERRRCVLEAMPANWGRSLRGTRVSRNVAVVCKANFALALPGHFGIETPRGGTKTTLKRAKAYEAF